MSADGRSTKLCEEEEEEEEKEEETEEENLSTTLQTFSWTRIMKQSSINFVLSKLKQA